ncbi:MAG: hypothetical protein CSA36_01610 [Draconibacterium sp.]|nr:MAG: hypothetical protein CSA36_01610 [Draconibacterium sp.]
MMVYNYIFYTFYRFWEKVPFRWWSEWKAVITMCFLVIFTLSSISNVVMYESHLDLIPQTRILPIVIAALIFGLHYYLFLYDDKWKIKILRFKNFDSKKDTLGIILVVLFSGLIITSLIYSYYLLSIVDWKSIE